MLIAKPKRKQSVPYKPKKCIGLLPKRPMNARVSRSRKPLINLFQPNFVTPYFLGLCSTIFSPIFKTRQFREHRNITVHFTVHFHAFYNFIFICFEATIKIVEFYARRSARNGIKNFRGKIFR